MALDAAGMGTFVWYANEDRTEPDARMLELFALPAGGVLSLATALASMIHPDDVHRYGRAVAAAFDPAGDRELSQEIRVDRGDGTYRWVQVTARAFFEGQPPRPDRLVGVAADITRRRRTEDALLESEARLRRVEHQTALELQRALLPVRTLAPAGGTAAARYVPGSVTLEVGGDWYDTFELAGGRMALTVGDVVGHGLAAATAMGKMRVAMGALAPHADGPGALLTHLDGFAAANAEIRFATACYAVLDPGTRELRYASAGHPPMLVVTADGRTRWLDAGGSAPITGRDIGTRPEAIEILEPCSVLVLYSDGLVERRRETITTGLDRLARAATALREAPVGDICDGLLTALGVAEHRADDVVVLCLRVPAAGPEPFRQTLTDRHELARLRGSLRAWRRTIQPVDQGEDNLLLAVNEACANAIEHAYPGDRPGTIEVVVRHDPDGTYLVTVRDFGTWRPPAADPPLQRGRGLRIIGQLSRELERRSTADGTQVRFRLPAKETTR